VTWKRGGLGLVELEQLRPGQVAGRTRARLAGGPGAHLLGEEGAHLGAAQAAQRAEVGLEGSGLGLDSQRADQRRGVLGPADLADRLGRAGARQRHRGLAHDADEHVGVFAAAAAAEGLGVVVQRAEAVGLGDAFLDAGHQGRRGARAVLGHPLHGEVQGVARGAVEVSQEARQEVPLGRGLVGRDQARRRREPVGRRGRRRLGLAAGGGQQQEGGAQDRASRRVESLPHVGH
jgi:hypothetical protein